MTSRQAKPAVIHNTADSLHERIDKTVDTVGSTLEEAAESVQAAAHRAVDQGSSAAKYGHEWGNQTKSRVVKAVAKDPIQAVAWVVAASLLTGFFLRGRRRR